MSSQLRINVDSNASERHNLMTGRLNPAKAKKPIRKFTRTTQELTSGPQQRNWKGLLLSVLVIVIVCVIVGISAWLLQPPEDGQEYTYSYDYEAMFDMSWKPYSTSGKWIGDSFVYQDRSMNVIIERKDSAEVLISNSTLENLGIYQCSVSPDLKYALLAYDFQNVYRHSSTAKYYIYAISTGNHVPLHGDVLQYAEWGTAGNQIVYVFNYDIYHKKDVDATAERISVTGGNSPGNIYNGIADWIYEEEMIRSTVANWMSLAGSYLAYASFNDTQVDDVNIVQYSMPYSQVQTIKYPKTGFPNPTVQLFIYDSASKNSARVDIPEFFRRRQPLLNSVVWASDDNVLISWSNRYQNISATYLCEVSTEPNLNVTCREIHKQIADGWIHYVASPPLAGPEGVFFQIQEKTLGGRGNFHHVLMVNYSVNPAKTSFLTTGTWEVTKLLAYDKENDKVYFQSNEEGPGKRHIHSVGTQNPNPESSPRCQTCEQSCQYVTGAFASPPTEMFFDCLGPEVPYFGILSLKNKEFTSLEANPEIQGKLPITKLPEVVEDVVTINGEDGDYELAVKLFMPPNRGDKKCPLLVQVYAGPGNQQINSKFRLDWKTYLATNEDIAVMIFDGRGSGFKGARIMKEVSRRLGVYEIEDQISAIKQVLKKHPYLDETKVAIWGWSYGGYASAMAASHPISVKENLIKCAISVAPVTDWTLYDSIYTERYMGSPVNNYIRYSESSLLSRAKSFNHFKYLLIHGTRDDNVHFQNSAVLESALVRHGVVHRYQVYTDETHSLTNEPKWTQRHLYKLMNEFLTDCFRDS